MPERLRRDTLPMELPMKTETSGTDYDHESSEAKPNVFIESITLQTTKHEIEVGERAIVAPIFFPSRNKSIWKDKKRSVP